MAVQSAKYLKIMADAAVDALDVGAGEPVLNIYDAEDTLIAVFDLDTTAAFGAATLASPSVATATGLPIATTGEAAAGTGTDASYGTLVDGNGDVAVTGSCGVGSGDIQLDNLSIASGQTVNLTALSWSNVSGT